MSISAEEKLKTDVFERFAVVDHELTVRLDYDDIDELLHVYNLQFSGKYVKLNKNGDKYFIKGACILNQNGKALVALEYSPVVKVKRVEGEFYRNRPTNRHVRPVHEFLDGRFTIKERIEEKVLQPKNVLKEN